MAEFLMLLTSDQQRHATVDPAEAEASTAKVIAWFDEHARTGAVVPGGGKRLLGPETAKTVAFEDGPPFTTDGRFAETKEQIGGYALLNVPDMHAAIELVKTWPGLAGSKIEIRPVFPAVYSRALLH
jgi:hypothetical protein